MHGTTSHVCGTTMQFPPAEYKPHPSLSYHRCNKIHSACFGDLRVRLCKFLVIWNTQQANQTLTAVRLIMKTPRVEHISPVLVKLHWLPVYCRIEYKMLIYAYQAVNGTAPQYLCELLKKYNPARALRSQDTQQLVVPKRKLATFGGRAFSAAAPKLWNALPTSIRCAPSLDIFKKVLKSQLFVTEYD